jgi:hypothetical protein
MRERNDPIACHLNATSGDDRNYRPPGSSFGFK